MTEEGVGDAVDAPATHVQGQAQPNDPDQQPQQEQQPDWKEQLKSTIFRMVFFWMVMNWMKGNRVETRLNPD